MVVLVPQVSFIEVTLKTSRYREKEIWGRKAGLGPKK